MLRNVILLLLLATVFGSMEVAQKISKEEVAKLTKDKNDKPTEEEAKGDKSEDVPEDCVQEFEKGVSYYLRVVSDPKEKIFIVAERPITITKNHAYSKTHEPTILKAFPLEQLTSSDEKWDIQKFEMKENSLRAQFEGDRNGVLGTVYGVLGQYTLDFNGLYLEDREKTKATTPSVLKIDGGMLKVGDTFIKVGAGIYPGQVWGKTKKDMLKMEKIKFNLTKGTDYHHVCLVKANAGTYLSEDAKKKNSEVQDKWFNDQIEGLLTKNDDHFKIKTDPETEKVFKEEFDRLMSLYLFPNDTLMEVALKKLSEVYYDYNQEAQDYDFKTFLGKFGDLDLLTDVQVRMKAVEIATNLAVAKLHPGLKEFGKYCETTKDVHNIKGLHKQMSANGKELKHYDSKIPEALKQMSEGATAADVQSAVEEQLKKEDKEIHSAHAKDANLSEEEYEKVRSENPGFNLMQKLKPDHFKKFLESYGENKGEEVKEEAFEEMLQEHVKHHENDEDELAQKYKEHGNWCQQYVKKWVAKCEGTPCLREKFEKMFQARDDVAKGCNDDEGIKKVFEETAKECDDDDEDGFFAKIKEKAQKLYATVTGTDSDGSPLKAGDEGSSAFSLSLFSLMTLFFLY